MLQRLFWGNNCGNENDRDDHSERSRSLENEEFYKNCIR